MTSKSIKQFRPSRNSRYKQGYINTNTCKKLLDHTNPVIYRSSYEISFIRWMEASRKVRGWASECVCIPYFLNGRQRRYFPDFYLEMADGTRLLVEIKPKNQTTPPLNENSWAWQTWITNCHKWKAAQEWCTHHGMGFKIITENTIHRLG